MPYTGREYGLRIDRWVDERRDYEKSTQAAIAYLSDPRDARIVVSGSSQVQWRAGASRSFDDDDNTINFWELTGIHDETKNYVPKLIAATIIAKEPNDTALRGAVSRACRVGDDHGSDQHGPRRDRRAAEVPVETIRALNPPSPARAYANGEVYFPVHIPAEQVQIFTQNYYEIAPEERIEIPAEHMFAPAKRPSGSPVRTGWTAATSSS